MILLSHLRISNQSLGVLWFLDFQKNRSPEMEDIFFEKNVGLGTFRVRYAGTNGWVANTLFTFQPNVRELPPDSPFIVYTNGDLGLNTGVSNASYILKWRVRVLNSGYWSYSGISFYTGSYFYDFPVVCVASTSVVFLYNNINGWYSIGISSNKWYEIEYKVRVLNWAPFTVDHGVVVYDIDSGIRTQVGGVNVYNQTMNFENRLSFIYAGWGLENVFPYEFDYIRVAGSTETDLFEL